jgi:hypothetical protein
MGLGPNQSSLLQRTGMPALVWRDPFAMQMEQQDRGEARRLKAIWHATKNKKPKKSLAPVSPMPKEKGLPRRWQWDGEDIPSRGLVKGLAYDGLVIREAGFKLPPMPKKQKRAQQLEVL